VTLVPDDDDNHLLRFSGKVDVLAMLADLRDDGIRAAPNYVLFSHEVQANPLWGNPLWGNPLWGNPLWGNPLYGNPLWGNPLYGNPLGGNPSDGTGLYFNQEELTGKRPSTARPALAPMTAPKPWTKKRASPTIVVLDTGFADSTHCPHALHFLSKTGPADLDRPDEDRDVAHALDPVAGHGTFIAGIIESLVPGRELSVTRVLSTQGDGDTWDISEKLREVASTATDQTILNLSFGGHAEDMEPDEMWLLARAIRQVQAAGAVVVASAGNAATSRPSYPACLPGVVSVGALGEYGPAPFTNYGPWVRACAPGVDTVSAFYTKFKGPIRLGPIDPDNFNGWARWSGTSFAAPVVVAALAREMLRSKCSAADAVRSVIDAPKLFRIPYLGTVVNLSTARDPLDPSKE
jgi:hypothetical protein